jgi:hypothetical protein
MEKKNLLTAICLSVFLIVSIGLMAQESDPDDNYFEIYQAKLNYLNDLANQEGKELWELKEYKHFGIWAEHFWTKHGQNGSMSEFGAAINNYYENNNDAEGDFELAWNYNAPDGLWPHIDPTEINNNAGQGLIISLWVDEDSVDHIMAGGQYCGGLWETHDGGDNWYNISESEPMIQGISSIWVNQNDEREIFVTTSYDAETPSGYTNGLFYTYNGGTTWYLNNCLVYENGVSSIYYPNGNSRFSPITFLRNPIDTNIMYLTICRKLLRSTNNGQSWNVILSRPEVNGYYVPWMGRQYFHDMAFDPVDPSILYLCGPEAFRIENNGESIIEITDSILAYPGNSDTITKTIMVDADSKYTNNIWFTAISQNGKKLLIINYNKLDSNYTIWKKEYSDEISQGFFQCEISTINPDRIIIGGAIPKYFKFSLNQTNEMGYGYGFHNDLRSCIYTDDGNGNEIVYFGTDGGITKEINPDITNNWYYIANDGTNGIRNIDVQGFDVSRYGEDLLVIGTSHDCNIRKKDDVFLRVFEEGGGDVQSVLIDSENPYKFFAVQYGHPEIEYTTNMGHPSGTLIENYPQTADNPPILFYKPNQSRILYTGFNGVIWEFDTDNIPPTPISNPVSYSWQNDGYVDRYIKEVGVSNDLENMFFVSTNRYWKGWDNFYCTSGNPHINVIFKVTITSNDLVFTDLTDDPNLDKGLCGGPITGIAVEVNENDTIVYASCGLTSTSDDPQKNKKVYYSKDIGETWFAMAEGLDPQIPVNDIQYHKESGLLFLASDVGVYYYDRLDSIWRNITDNLPPMSYNRIRFSFLKNKILVGSHAKGVWEADLPCFYDSIPDTLFNTKTWNCSIALHNDLIIENGASLTIKKEVYMPPQAKIIVKRGGILIVDGGKITSSCGEMWKGIEVWGDPTLSSIGDNHGMVVVINEGTIENAIVGIQTVKMVESGGFSDPDLAYAGGIVQTVNANFINNKTAISYYKYPATGYTHIYSGFNYFSDFKTNESYIGSTAPDYFVRMSEVNKVKYKACTFINNKPQHHYGSGIYSINSQYILESYEFGSTIENCIFEDLNYGIYGLSTTPNRFPEILKAEFNNNFKGIYFSAITLSKVWDCDFTTTPNQSGGYGLYLDGCKGYRIEGNSFTQTTEDAIGIIVNDTRPTEGELIYRNKFHDMKFGIIAQNRNRNRAGIGLVLKCNEYDNTYWNEVVTCKVPFMTTEYGIASSQGANGSAPDAPAGNLFSNTGPTGVATDIYNDANNITYYYHDYPLEALYPEFHTPIKVNPIPVYALWNQFSCPPTNEGSDGGQASESELMEDLALSGFNVDSIQGVINILKDGGSTEDMKWEVDMSTPPETYEVYNELVNNSPYISDTVMEAAIEKEAVLPNVMIRDVMVANPHNAKNEELMTKIEERSDPMPEYMKAQILQGRSLVSVFEDLQSEYAFYKQKRKEVYTQLVETYLNDTLNPESALNSLESLLANEHDLSAKYQQAALSVEQGAWDTGLDLINDIPQQFNLTEEEVAENDQIEELYSMMAQLATEGKTMMDASSAQINELVVIEASETGTSSVYSRNILIDLAAMEYEEPILLPDAYKVAEVQQEQEVLKQMLAEHHYLKVFPNPAGDYLIIEHNLEMENESAYIEIGNIRGETIRQVQLTGKHNQLTVDIKMLEPGVYISTLFNDKKEIESVKFTKVK